MEQHDEPAHEEPALEASPEAPVTPEDAPGIAPPAEEAAAGPTEAAEAAPAEAAATEAAASADAAAPVEAAAAPGEPELVEVWRPGGRHDDRKPRHERHRHQRHHNQRPQQAGAEAGAAPAEGEAAQSADGEKRNERHRHGGGHRRDGAKDFRKPREGGEGAPRQEGRDDKNRRFEGKDRDNKDRDRNKGKFGGDRDKGRDNRGRDRDKGRDRQGGPSLRPYASSANPRERDRPADPNSPFAKLAALKEQLSGRKE
jgi:ATP-dependent RNA helicase SUPV3L1/SUV3